MNTQAISGQRSAVRDRHSALSYESRATSHVSRRRSRMGFTLVELVLVVILIAILASIAVPRFVNLSRQADIAATRGAIGAIRGAIVMDYASRTLVSRGVAKFPNVVYHSWFMEMHVPLNEVANSSAVTIMCNGCVEGTQVTNIVDEFTSDVDMGGVNIPSITNLAARATSAASASNNLCCITGFACVAEVTPTIGWVYESNGDYEGVVKPCGDNSSTTGFTDDLAEAW